MIPYVIPAMCLKPIERISPSRYVSLEACFLREVWAANEQVSLLLPRPPAAHLGIVIHKILELTVKGIIKGDEAIYDCWNEEIAMIEKNMKGNWLEEHLAPLSKTAPNYEVKRQMCFLRVKTLLYHRSRGLFRSDKGMQSEVPVKTSDGTVYGKIDAVQFHRDGVEIIDYKTGAITDVLYGDDSVKLAYEKQMKLYAGLFHSEYGTWPAKMTIIGLNGEVYNIRLEIDECLNIVEDAKRQLNRVNKLILNREPPDHLARASPNACKYCSFRPACSVYWKERQNTLEWPSDFCGAIKAKQTLGNGLVRIMLGDGKIDIIVRGLLPSRHKFLLEEAKRVMFCDMRRDNSPGHFTEGYRTTGYIVQ